MKTPNGSGHSRDGKSKRDVLREIRNEALDLFCRAHTTTTLRFMDYKEAAVSYNRALEAENDARFNFIVQDASLILAMYDKVMGREKP